MVVWRQISFHNGCSSSIVFISEVHDWVIFIVIFINIMNIAIIISVVYSKSSNLNYYSNEVLEFLWVSIPRVILFVLAIPSLHCLYLTEEAHSPRVTLKVVGHQWYWSYEYGGFRSLSYDSYLVTNGDLNRLLEVDAEVCIPVYTEVRILVSRSDVLHRWAISPLGVKVDAIPGRINQVIVWPKKVGNYYGQCSEICGAMHSFIPIHARVLPFYEFTLWLMSK